MIIGGQKGDPEEERLTYVLPVTRKDQRTGADLSARGFGATPPMRGFRPTDHVGHKVVQGAADGGEDTVAATTGDNQWDTTYYG